MTEEQSSRSSSPDSELSQSNRSAFNLGRRITGIGALFACALLVDPAQSVADVTSLADINQAVVLHALVIPALAALGLWLVLPKPTVLAICVLMLAGAHSEPGQGDLFASYLYPALALMAGLYLTYSFLGSGKSGPPPTDHTS